jgi:hypothetical protein
MGTSKARICAIDAGSPSTVHRAQRQDPAGQQLDKSRTVVYTPPTTVSADDAGAATASMRQTAVGVGDLTDGERAAAAVVTRQRGGRRGARSRALDGDRVLRLLL